MAGALAVELMAAVLQHPLGVAAPSPQQQEQLPAVELPLGAPPHMVRPAPRVTAAPALAC